MNILHSALLSFDAPTLLALAGIYLASATLSGLSGFGFSAIGALTLCVVPPQFGVCMLLLLSTFTQAMSMGSLRAELRAARRTGWRQGFLPYALGGVLGLPLGLQILAHSPPQGLLLALGGLLVAYSTYSILKPKSLSLPSGSTSMGGAMAVGAIGGVLGGFSAAPGIALVVWNGLKNVPKEHGRAVTQPFILTMQVIALAMVAVGQPALFDARLLALLALVLPIAWVGNRIGIALYRRADHFDYRRITLAALGLSGLSMVLKVGLFA